MTEDEARKFHEEVLVTADNGCDNCVYAIHKKAAEAFPEFPWMQWYEEWPGE